jgi:hypothetical protein
MMYGKELGAGFMPNVCTVVLLVAALAVVIQNGNGFPLQILPSGYAPIDIWIPTTDKIMRGKLWIVFASFLSKRYVSTCRTSSFSPSSSCSAIQPWIFVGIGNPCEKYQSTRRNVSSSHIDFEIQ